MELNQDKLINLTAEITSAHVSHNIVSVRELAPMIESVFEALKGLGAREADTGPQKPTGAVSLRASVKPSHLVSMIDGKHYKMLKKHLTRHGYTPNSYREAFNLPRDYPMVAPEYAEMRSAIAKSIGLGHKRWASRRS